MAYTIKQPLYVTKTAIATKPAPTISTTTVKPAPVVATVQPTVIQSIMPVAPLPIAQLPIAQQPVLQTAVKAPITTALEPSPVYPAHISPTPTRNFMTTVLQTQALLAAKDSTLYKPTIESTPDAAIKTSTLTAPTVGKSSTLSTPTVVDAQVFSVQQPIAPMPVIFAPSTPEVYYGVSDRGGGSSPGARPSSQSSSGSGGGSGSGSPPTAKPSMIYDPDAGVMTLPPAPVPTKKTPWLLIGAIAVGAYLILK